MLQKYNFISIKVFLLLGLWGLLLTLTPQKTYAAQQGAWLDRSSIKIGQKIYFDNKTDTSYNYFLIDDPDGCPDEIHEIRDNNTKAKLRIRQQQSSTSSCGVTSEDTVNLSDNGKSYHFFKWLDQSTITTSDERNTFKKDSNDGLFYEEGGDNCKDSIRTNGGQGTLIARTGGNNTSYDNAAYNDGPKPINPSGGKSIGSGCYEYDSINIDIGRVGNASKPADSGETYGATGATGSLDDESACENQGALGWVICPLIYLVDNVINFLDNQVESLLIVPQGDAQDPKLYDAWKIIRNIAYFILVPIMLVMVIGTALGFDFVSAYTVKRALPRLVAAVIFIALSWEFTSFLIEFTNQISRGVFGIIVSPFGAQNVGIRDIVSGAEGFATSAAVGGAVILAGLAGVLSVGIILSYSLVLLIGLLIGFAVLVARQVFILALTLVAPLAILAWIFPGNDKLWKSWWGIFSKLLLMFPLIIGLLAVGRVFATVGSVSADGVVETLVKLTAYILPYFFIPATFKFAGGAFATITGFAQDRSKGLFDRQRKYRAENRSKNFEDLKASNRFKGGTDKNFRGKLNKGLQTAALSPQGGLTLSARKRRARMQTARNQSDFASAQKLLESDAMGAIKGDDDKMWAMMNKDSEQGVRDELRRRAPDRFADPVSLDNAVAEVMRAKREGGARASKIASTIAQFGTGTGFNYRHDGVKDDMVDAVILASGDDNGLAGRIMASGRSAAMQSGRVDLAGGGFAKTMQILEKRRKSLATDKGSSYTSDDAYKEIMEDVLQSNAGAAVAGKVQGVKHLAPVMFEQVEDAMQTGENTARELAKIAGKYDVAQQVAPQNAEALADGVLSQEVDVASLNDQVRAKLAPMLTTYDYQPDPNNPDKVIAVPKAMKTKITVREAIEAYRDDDNFLEMRRELGVAGRNAAAQQQMIEQGLAGNVGQMPQGPVT